MPLVPARRPVEPGEPVFADPRATSMLNWTFPYPHSGVATARVAHGCGSDLRLPEHEFCSADIPTRLTPVRPASGSSSDRVHYTTGTGRRGQRSAWHSCQDAEMEIRMSSIRIGPLSGNSRSKSLPPATPTAGRPTPVASGTSVVDGSPAVGSLLPSTMVQSWEPPSLIRISQLLAVMSPTQIADPQDDHRAGPAPRQES